MLDRGSNETSAKFKNLQLKSIKREKKKECVAEEIFSIIFWTEIQFDGITFKLCTPSVPLVVITHGHYSIQAQATVFWDNAGDTSFKSTSEQSWGKVSSLVMSSSQAEKLPSWGISILKLKPSCRFF